MCLDFLETLIKIKLRDDTNLSSVNGTTNLRWDEIQMWQCNLTEIEGNFTNSSLNVYVGDGCVFQGMCYYE